MTFPRGYSPETLGLQLLAILSDMRLAITWAKHNAAVADAVAAAVSNNSPDGDRARTANAAITYVRRGPPDAAVPPMDTAAGVVDAKSAADAKKAKSPADPPNIVVVNLDYNKARWGTHKARYIPMRTVVEDCRATNPLSPRLYNAAVYCCLSYHIKGVCNGQCGRTSDNKPHMADQDAPLVNWTAEEIPIRWGVTA